MLLTTAVDRVGCVPEDTLQVMAVPPVTALALSFVRVRVDWYCPAEDPAATADTVYSSLRSVPLADVHVIVTLSAALDTW